ncbi:MAG: DUF3307 domain-containing protein [Pseudomonadota bacterium]
MFIFLRLLLAHVLADSLLQPDRMHQLKMTSILYQMLHATIFILCSLVLLFPFLNRFDTWAFIFALGLGHFLIDHLKINYSLKHQKRNGRTLLFLDQIAHLLTIAIIFVTPLKNLSYHSKIYGNDLIIVGIIFLIALIYLIMNRAKRVHAR